MARAYRDVDDIVVKGSGGDQPCDDPRSETGNSASDAPPLVRLLPRDGQRDRHNRTSQDDSHECLCKEINDPLGDEQKQTLT